MELEKTLLEAIIIALLLLIFQSFRAYLTKKGEFQATKEDIGGITATVERIKKDLNEQTELLKAHLLLSNQHKLNIKSAEREAILSFNNTAAAWIYSLVRFNMSSYNLENYKDLKIMSAQFSKRQYEFDLAEAHLELFMNGDGFIDLKYDLIVSVVHLEQVVSSAMHEAYWTYSKYEFDINFNADNHLKAIARNSLSKEIHEITTKLANDIPIQYEDVNKYRRQLTQIIRNRLEEL